MNLLHIVYGTEPSFSKRGRDAGSGGKTLAFGLLQRNGPVYTGVVPDYKKYFANSCPYLRENSHRVPEANLNYAWGIKVIP